MHDLTLGIPTRGYMNHQHVVSLLAGVGNGLFKSVDITPQLPVHQARTKIVERLHTDWLLFCDDDMVFTPTDVLRLLDTGKKFVSGLYRMRSRGAPHVVFKWDGKTKSYQLTDPPEKLAKVDASSLAFTLIHKDVFEAVGKEFNFRETFIGEDIDFIGRARALGIDMWVEPKVKIGHINEQVLRP